MRLECAIESCPCGNRCCNRQLQLGATLEIAVVDCGRKGVGVITLEDITEGCLVGEYVGEVMGREDAQLRSQLYRNGRHFYMMQNSADGVIDATQIGGRMRFVNHSCDPNCQVEKWCVRGQERCGVFAIRDVAAGDEITINYNFHSFGGEVRCSTYRDLLPV
ncbi:DNA binding protein [Phytophthora megakarya]|uniref:DNA binding protein n=1 Tax=Phytophthora megakarya TaxID=4795 RepID=A0A225UMU2_9STRA|nr:DNA binding protein [Phytophthora megakarya]